MRLPKIGERVTLQQFIELAPKGLELTNYNGEPLKRKVL